MSQLLESKMQAIDDLEESGEKFSNYRLYTQVRENSISLAFQGIISQDILSLIGLSLKRRPDSEIVAKRLFGIVVELAQNIYHYSASKAFSEKDKRDIGVGIITIGEAKNYYVVNSGNLIETESTGKVIARCAHVNSLGDEDLKQFQKEQRRMPHQGGGTGANIGLIEMVRRSGNPIIYSVDPVSAGYSFLTLSIRINK